MPDELPKRWPLVTSLQHRSTDLTKDARLINAYAEYDPQTEDYWVNKRPGVGTTTAFTGSTPHGMYTWRNDWYAWFGSRIYKNGGLLADTLAAQNGFFHFAPMLSATPQLFMSTRQRAYYTDGTTVTQVTDVDYPALTVPGCAYLDGTVYVMTAEGAIKGSDINNPASWNALNTITANAEGDRGVCLTRQNNYIVAIKEWVTQFFYDAGNATGSPLAPVQGATLPFGCYDGESVAEIDGTLLFVSQNRQLQLQVVRIDNLQLQIVSTPPVERAISQYIGGFFRAFTMKIAGHRFYILNRRASIDGSVATGDTTFVYDLDQKLWYEWRQISAGAETRFAFVDSAYYFNSGTPLNMLQTDGGAATTAPDYTTPTDAGAVFPVDIYTPNLDFNVNRRKTLSNLFFNCDQTAGSTLYIRNSDNDYTKWKNFRRLDLARKRPFLSGCGTFETRRAYHLRHSAPTAFRIRSMDMDLDLGTF